MFESMVYNQQRPQSVQQKKMMQNNMKNPFVSGHLKAESKQDIPPDYYSRDHYCLTQPTNTLTAGSVRTIIKLKYREGIFMPHQ